MVDKELTVVGAVCARGGSKGVPRKNLRPLEGTKPLIAYTIECAQQCPALSRIVVSTDDDEIAGVARQYGAEVPFMRPDHLAQDNSSKWDVFRHLVQTLEALDGKKIDILVDLDTGVPMRTPKDIEACLGVLVDGDADVVVTAYEAERNPYFNMVELATDGYAKIVKKTDTPVAARQSAPAVYSLSPAVFAIRRDVLWKYDHWSQSCLKIYEIPRERAVDIDTEIDYQFAQYLMSLRKV